MSSLPTSFPKSRIKVLLLENIDAVAVSAFENEKFQVEQVRGALGEEDLVAKIGDVHILGIRSKTLITPKVLEAAPRLLAIGCFCIGTDQVDLDAASQRGVAVFNSPYCNSRSVAELIIGQVESTSDFLLRLALLHSLTNKVIALARCLGDRSKEMHAGVWNKVSRGCHEVRGLVLGIVGYGHIGSQLSVLAEMLGMIVIFYDVINPLALGRAERCPSLADLLRRADFVTLHVPDTDETRGMITAKEIALMRPGTYLLNASRGKVVDLEALAGALRAGHLAGAYVDVYPSEPSANGPGFSTPLQGLPNVLMTPHVGGSTEEAQRAIGVEVSGHLISFMNQGKTFDSVNLPRLDPRSIVNVPQHRILSIHQNKPGFMKAINNILAEVNIASELLDTKGPVGYLIIDLDSDVSQEVKDQIAQHPYAIRTRLLF